DSLAATAIQTGDLTDFSANATLDNGATASLAGALRPIDDGYRVTLDRADLAQGQLAARLARRSTIDIQGQNAAIRDVELAVGGGRITANGAVAEQLDLAVSVSALPLAIANAVRPAL